MNTISNLKRNRTYRMVLAVLISLLILLGSTSANAQPVFTKSFDGEQPLLLNMNFDNQDATDSSGYGNDGTVYGATFVESPITSTGYAANFDGVDDYISIPDSDIWAFGTNSFTITTWIKDDDVISGNIDILSQNPIASNIDAIYYKIHTDGSIHYEIWQGNINRFEIQSSPGEIIQGKWYHLALVRNENNWNIYKNGISIASASSSWPVPNWDTFTFGAVNMGASPSGVFGFFKGMLDEIKIYNIALNQEEIQAMYEAEKPVGDTPEPLSTWTIEPGVRIVGTGGNMGAHNADIVKLPDNTYRMYYSDKCYSAMYPICIRSAISSDSLSWTVESGIRIGGGYGGHDGWASTGDTVVLPDGTYRMYYSIERYPFGEPQWSHTLSAVSTDGLIWTTEPGVRVDYGGPYDNLRAGGGRIVKLPDGSYRMYYGGFNSGDQGYRILSAISTDGINWTKEAGIRLDIGGIYDNMSVGDPSIIPVQGGYLMFYAGVSSPNVYISNILSAFSYDGLTWTKENGIRIPREPSCAGVSPDDIIQLSDNQYRMYFSVDKYQCWTYPRLSVYSAIGAISPLNNPPVLTVSNTTVSVNEANVAVNDGSISDLDGDSVNLNVDVGTASNNNDGTWSWSFPTSDGPAESQTVTITADDGNGGIANVSFDLTVNNVAPAIERVAVPVDPVNFNDQPINASATFSDPAGTYDVPYTCTVNYGDGNGPEAGVANSTACLGLDHTYAEPGVYVVTVTITDKDGGNTSAEATNYIVVYDPDGGFVTGGGWIDSPLGAYTPDATLTGKATFGFVSKYQKGANIPTGNTEFKFKIADLNFKSTSYDWLVIAGLKAMYKGTGTINGMGEYWFMLSAVDGDLPGGDGIDKFRIKIWDKATEEVIYDNQLGDLEDAELATELGGGSIVIHK